MNTLKNKTNKHIAKHQRDKTKTKEEKNTAATESRWKKNDRAAINKVLLITQSWPAQILAKGYSNVHDVCVCVSAYKQLRIQCFCLELISAVAD